jgi:hypothetical protein
MPMVVKAKSSLLILMLFASRSFFRDVAAVDELTIM